MIQIQALANKRTIQYLKEMIILFIYYNPDSREHNMSLTTIVPKPVSMSTPSAFKELVKLLRIFEARLLAWSATACLSYPAAET